MLAIKNNMMAANAARNLGQSYDALSKSVERLSSGLRINSAKDDAAGLAVRELVRADVAQLQQGSRNAQDAISMLQTAEGAMGVIDDLLIRMKELAEQAATDSYSTDQRTIMNNEFRQLAEEITRISTSTKFNEIAMLDSTATFNFHVGSSDTINITAQKTSADDLGLGNDGSGESITMLLGTANPNLTGFVTGSNVAEDNDGTFSIQFGAEAAIAITLDQGTDYSLNEIVQKINVASQAASGYNAASTVYDSTTGMYFLKVAAETNGNVALTWTTDQIGMAQANFSNTNGVDGDEVTIGTKADATNALTALTTAIQSKDLYRAKLGYMMNRLESAVSVVDIQAENLRSAESRISDVDTATETAALTRNQVLAQAGISMLAQANTMPQMALKLLG